ncbi:hypothetical protein BS47DRAFT_1372183 [Hydnum rufescens UP504]|uniref:Glycerol transporter n=1 Tax=Hydnum rufescens UP504 TaxID=1448309 RepID=A0A9P6DU43_9AGAM|nr:hypothetical protein BS47DRAFT_1372183 [Hydnum rufescens UP504]
MASAPYHSPPPDLSWSVNGIVDLTVHVDSSTKFQSDSQASNVRVPRWRTPEFALYAVIFVIVVPYMAMSAVELSQHPKATHPNYPSYQHRLSRGWLFGRAVDNSDTQYRSFRDNIPGLCFLSSLYLGSGYLYTRIAIPGNTPTTSLEYRTQFISVFSCIMLCALHGTSALKIFAILYVNYHIAKQTRGVPVGVLLTWIFNISIIFANELFDGYHYAALHPALGPLDRIRGLYPRWHVGFNITMLRLVSFNLDHYWASSQTGDSLNERLRRSTAHPLGVYNFTNYLAYAIYPPLYIAGPIMTFNDFMWQLRRPHSMSAYARASYAARFFFSFIVMEFVLHYIYVVAIKDTKAWNGDTAFQLAMIGYWNLLILWLKMDPPENMVRCISNAYSTLGFWRSWHRSYNLWLIRYIYVPVGGSTSTILPKLVVFTFVALWHDLSMRLLIWGWLISLFILPEVIATAVLPESKYGEKPWYRHVCAAGGVMNLLMMMTANLVGFVLGTEGMVYLAGKLFGTWEGMRFLSIALPSLFVAIQVMFEYREAEKRRGIVRRC